MHLARLRKLVNAMENIKEVRYELRVLKEIEITGFNMNTWGECGSAACAAGTIAVIPWFNAQGLHTYNEGMSEFTPAYSGLIGYPALAKFFGISTEKAHEFFNPGSYQPLSGYEITPEHVARRVKKYIRQIEERQKEHRHG